MYGQFTIISSSGIILTYSIAGFNLQLGQLVYVSLKQGHKDKRAIAVLLNFCEKPSFECRDIDDILPNDISLKSTQLAIMNRVAAYYLTSFESSVRLLAPGFLWQVNKIPSVLKYFEKIKTWLPKIAESKPPIVLTAKQQVVYDFILKNLNETILLHGVTGSGKTEIYLTVAQHIVNSGKNCLILVPEISLTPQMSARFRNIFGESLAILHSGISPANLIKEWSAIYLAKVKVVLGVRSAIFCPIENLGLIVVDEEHDQSYKSSERPAYNARDVAVMRAKLENACCLLGSATPSLESFWNTQIQKYKYIELTDKHAVSTKVTKLVFDGMPGTIIAPGILDLIRKNHEDNFQTMVLLNRRGFVNYALCVSCRTPLSCPNCSVATTIHNFGKREICHYCDFNREMRKICPNCSNDHFLLKGVGTQNIESFLQTEFPALRIERLDRDNLTSHTKLAKILERFATNQTECLVGTQILAKGHDFAKVTLIVILNLEDSLFLPDFRAGEKTFHLLTQAMGRVGRSEHAGVIALQSVVKNHPIIDFALKNEIYLFLTRELKNRQRAGLPPYSRIILLEIKHKEKITAEKHAKNIKNICLNFWKQKNYTPNEVFLSGPYDAPIEKINCIYRLHICVHMSKNLHPIQCIPDILYSSSRIKNILRIDVDPQSFM